MDERTAREQIDNNIAMWSRGVDITKDQFAFAVVEKSSGELIGSIQVSKYHGKKKLKNFEVGYDIGEAYQNKGYANEAAKEIVKWAMPQIIDAGEAPKIVGKAEHKNYASCKVLEKSGFSFMKKELFCRVYEING